MTERARHPRNADGLDLGLVLTELDDCVTTVSDLKAWALRSGVRFASVFEAPGLIWARLAASDELGGPIVFVRASGGRWQRKL